MNNQNVNETLAAGENQRMATLLKTPDLLKEYLGKLDETYWTTHANKWVWGKCQEHYEEHRAVPSLGALQNYAEKMNDYEKLLKSSTKLLLEECETMSPLAPDYFRATCMAEARDTKIKSAIIASIETKNWSGLRDAINSTFRETNPLPKALDMKSLMTKPSSDSQNLLNEWAFERQAILAVVAPTGIGKSVLTMQLATHFAAGKSTIGFAPKRPYRVLAIQNEDSDNDIALMRDGSMSLLNDQEKQMVFENLFFIRLRGTSGKSFLNALESYCEEYDPDIIFVNPLLKYYGGDPLNTRDVSEFLNDLEPILERHNCGLILVHHTIKQSKQSRMNQVDSSYSGFGSSAWSNSVRDTIEIRKTNTDGYYKLITGKRSSKWGWQERFLKRSDTPTLPNWTDVDGTFLKTLMESEKKSPAGNETKNAILSAIPQRPESITIRELSMLVGVSDKTIRRTLSILLEEKRIAVAVSTDTDKLKRYHRIGKE